jgi:hypothetical protein
VLELAIVGVAGTAIGGILASWAILLLQERRDDKRGPVKEVAAARAVAVDAAARAIFGRSAEISHSLEHLADGDDYEARVREDVRELRRLSRERAQLLGAGVVDAVTRYTDQVLQELPTITQGNGPSDVLQRQGTFLAGTLEGAAPGWTL